MDGDDGIGEILCPVDGDGRNSDKWLLRQSRFQVSQRRVPFNIPKVEAVGMDDEIDDVVEGGGCSIKRCIVKRPGGRPLFLASDTVRGGGETGIRVLAPAETDGDTGRHVRGWAGRRGAPLECYEAQSSALTC